LSGRRTLSKPDYELVERVAFNSIPEARAKIIWALYDDGVRRVTDFERRVNVSKPTVRRHLEDLVRLGLARRRNPGAGKLATYQPTALGRRYLDVARGSKDVNHGT
jgi:DNA-binding HxlR family transcriptional regulator